MRLLGRWNWWLPAGVARIFRVEPSPLQPAQALTGGGWPEQGAALAVSTAADRRGSPPRTQSGSPPHTGDN